MEIDFQKWIKPTQEKFVVEEWLEYAPASGYVNIGWHGNYEHDTLEQAEYFASQWLKAIMGEDTVAYGKWEQEYDEDGEPEPMPIKAAYRIIKRVVTEEVVSSAMEKLK